MTERDRMILDDDIDMIKDNLNRMCTCDNIQDLGYMYGWAIRGLVRIYRINLYRLTDKGSNTMTIDEAIKKAEELVELNEDQARVYREQGDIIGAWSYEECANEHRQLVEWLRELQKCNTILDELKDEIKRAFDDLTESEEYGEDDSYTEYNRGCVWGLLHSYEMFGREYEEVNADDCNL